MPYLTPSERYLLKTYSINIFAISRKTVIENKFAVFFVAEKSGFKGKNDLYLENISKRDIMKYHYSGGILWEILKEKLS